MGNEHSKNKKSQTKAEQGLEKHQNGGLNGQTVISSKDLENGVVSEDAVQQKSEPLITTDPGLDEVEGSGNNHVDRPEDHVLVIEKVEEKQENQNAEEPQTTPDPTPQKEEPKETSEEKVNFFDKLFKKKKETTPKEETVEESSTEDQTVPVTETDAIQSEPPTDVKGDTESSKEPDSVSLINPSPEEVETSEIGEDINHLVEKQEENSQTEENPVMNFFKTLVTQVTPKTPKKETAIPDVTKDQSQKEPQPTATTATATAAIQAVDSPAVPKGMSFPPPPPPEPPKMESKGGAAAPALKSTPKEEPKEAAKEPEAPKEKSAKGSPFSKLFSPKIVEAAPQPVEVQKVDPSKASTLEAAAKPEPPPVQEEQKVPTKSSPFRSFFKPKNAEPKKEATAPPADAAAAQSVKVKEEPKGGVAKSPEAPVDNKSVSETSQGGEDSANIPKRLEKRNSIHLFFRNLAQKRHSDAGVQTEPVTAASAPEKAK